MVGVSIDNATLGVGACDVAWDLGLGLCCQDEGIGVGYESWV